MRKTKRKWCPIIRSIIPALTIILLVAFLEKRTIQDVKVEWVVDDKLKGVAEHWIPKRKPKSDTLLFELFIYSHREDADGSCQQLTMDDSNDGYCVFKSETYSRQCVIHTVDSTFFKVIGVLNCIALDYS